MNHNILDKMWGKSDYPYKLANTILFVPLGCKSCAHQQLQNPQHVPEVRPANLMQLLQQDAVGQWHKGQAHLVHLI